MNKDMYIYDCRFLCNKNDVVFHVEQFGKSIEEVEHFWKDYFKNDSDYIFIDAKLKSEIITWDK